jgi:hypothetical protein
MVTILPVDNRANQESEDDVIMQDQEEMPAEDDTVEPEMNLSTAERKEATLPLPATLFAGPYRSTFALKVAETTPDELDCLKHVNCGYLSTNGLPPTLRQLKQHAQSLTVLIKHMTISTLPSVIDSRNLSADGIKEFHENESFDWLNDLTKPYTNDDRHHKMPLTSLLNTMDSAPIESNKYLNLCPLHRADVRAPRNGISLPYATHQTLIQHANEVLELLDHEYSAKGGLLSILPPQDQKEDRELAETTLLGQLILYTSRLVQRVHDLERQYANALEVIKGEAAVPHQALSVLGPHGRRPRELVYPQDRFILVNAGDDIWQYLNNEFQIKEVADEEAAVKARQQGLMGEALWKEEGSRDSAKGITALDISTRYYRLRNDPLDTVFIIPAYQEHPGTKVLREMESQPTVVSVVKPVWPERASMWEMRNRENLEELKNLRNEHITLKVEAEYAKEIAKGVSMDQQLKAQELREVKAKTNKKLKDAQTEIERLNTVLKEPVHQSQLKVVEESRVAIKAKNEALAAEQEFKKKTEALQQEHTKAENITRERERFRAKEEARLKRMEQTLQERHNLSMKKLNDKDADIARAASVTNDKLKALWEEQVKEQQIVIEFLKRKASTVLQGDHQPSAEDRAKGTAMANEMIDKMQSAGAEKLGASTTGLLKRGSNVSGGGQRAGGDQGTGQDNSMKEGYGVEPGDIINEHSSLGAYAENPTSSANAKQGNGTTGEGKTVTWKAGKRYRNKNNIVTWGMEDIKNVELVEGNESADDEDEDWYDDKDVDEEEDESTNELMRFS